MDVDNDKGAWRQGITASLMIAILMIGPASAGATDPEEWVPLDPEDPVYAELEACVDDIIDWAGSNGQEPVVDSDGVPDCIAELAAWACVWGSDWAVADWVEGIQTTQEAVYAAQSIRSVSLVVNGAVQRDGTTLVREVTVDTRPGCDSPNVFGGALVWGTNHLDAKVFAEWVLETFVREEAS